MSLSFCTHNIYTVTCNLCQHKTAGEKRQTIAVNRQKIIVESRGKYNRYPDQQEFEILQRWAAREGLHVGRSVQRV